ncbi:MAG: class I SAM-dependent methyltransferase [Lewinellaceae bacterium]|nr:class I SAM-dependent methyltransferase [Lewinellaceae bacterium]
MLKKIYQFLHPRYQSLFLEYKVEMKPRHGHGLPPHARLYDIINAHRAEYAWWMEKIRQYKPQLQSILKADAVQDAIQPGWNNGFLPGMDIMALYTVLAELKPRRYVEIGSGNSTKVAHKAKTDLGLNTEIISIDPYPRAEIDHLADQIIRTPFEQLDNAFLRDLNENDVLFVDNSHRVLPNSDATVFFLEVLPELKKGVVVHIHDIYIPYDYPQFMCDRFYSEQYALAAFLLANPQHYIPMLPNYFISEDVELHSLITDMWEHPNLEGVERHGGSFWLKIGA